MSLDTIDLLELATEEKEVELILPELLITSAKQQLCSIQDMLLVS